VSALTPAGQGHPAAKSVLFRPLDVLLLVLVVGLGTWSTWRLFAAPSGSRAVVWLDGRRAAWYPLGGGIRRDSVQGVMGMIVLEHGEGAIRVAHAPCQGKLCQRQGKAARVGEKLVCVPSRVVVVIESDAGEQGQYDAIH
jgi:hypothetical protein